MMTKKQYAVLMVTSVMLVILMFANLALAHRAQATNNQILEAQVFINKNRPVDGALQQLAIRTAQAAEKEPKMKDLLAKYGIQAKAKTP
jgi:hypothetical protein